MFYTLHRLVKGLMWVGVLACFYWLWLQREALEPVYVWYDVYENGGIDRTEPLPTISGVGLHLVDGHSFRIANNKQLYTVRLTGFATPEPPFSPSEIALEKARREFLRGAIVSNRVHVEVTYSNMNNLLGVVHVGKTNVNIHFLTNGLGHFRQEYIKSLPRDLQYRFFSAARAQRKWREQAQREAMAMND